MSFFNKNYLLFNFDFMSYHSSKINLDKSFLNDILIKDKFLLDFCFLSKNRFNIVLFNSILDLYLFLSKEKSKKYFILDVKENIFFSSFYFKNTLQRFIRNSNVIMFLKNFFSLKKFFFFLNFSFFRFK